jgi:hypothetical protein
MVPPVVVAVRVAVPPKPMVAEGDTEMTGVAGAVFIVKVPALVAVPNGVVTATVPEVVDGTVAVILVALTTV